MTPYLEYIVPPDEAGQTAGTLIRRQLGVSAGLLRRLKRLEGGITLDGRPVTTRARAEAGQRLRVRAEGAMPPFSIIPVAGPLDMVFEDTHLLILNKPAGLAVHPSRGHYTDTLANRVAEYLGPQVPFRAINRLDRGTSGLICLAKTQYAAQRLGGQLAGREIVRVYRAVVEGVGLPLAGTVDQPIGRVPGKGIARQVDPQGQRAVTHFRVLAEGPRRSLVELVLETGRTHQIRVHMAHLGCPVAGDFMYGTELPHLPGQALHACHLGLAHPVGLEPLCFEAPPPAYFEALLASREAE